MSPREHRLAIGLLLVVVLGGGGFLYKQFYLNAMDDRQATIERLQKEIEEKNERVAQVRKQKHILDTARLLSLPPDEDLDRREYQKYLEELLRQSGFAAGSFRITAEQPDRNSSPKLPGRKDPVYVSLPFIVQVHGSLSSLVEAMERFYQTGLLHRIKGLSILRPLTTTNQQGQQRPNELEFNLTIEAVVLNGADHRPYLLPNISRRLLVIDVVTAMRRGPPGLALVPWAISPAGPGGPHQPSEPRRQYASIAGKNIFFGPQILAPERQREDVELTRYVYLTHTSRDDQRVEAFLYDRLTNKQTRLRTSPGFDSFKIAAADEEQAMRGKVLQISQRGVIFRVNENYHYLHIGENLEDALKKSLTADELKTLGLVEAPIKKEGPGQ